MRPITVIPWENDFLSGLADLLHDATGGHPGNALVVFPHRRPRRYFSDRLARDARFPKPCLAPEVQTVGEFLSSMRASLEPAPPAPAELLDRVGLLHRSVQAVRESGVEGLLAGLDLDGGTFFPWGVRLDGLFEELFRHRVEPSDLHYLEGQVQPFAAALLGQLEAIGDHYRAALDERGWTTPGYDAFLAAERADAIVDALGDRPVFLAGFYALGGAEERVFRALWENGAHLLVHADRDIGRGRRGHWSCGEITELIRRWGATADLLDRPDAAPLPGPVVPEKSRGRKREMRFYEGYDLHSQLAALKRELGDRTDSSDAAVVVPDTGMLMPVLHHLPVKDVNISVGYPLNRSTLLRLVETLMRLQETARPPHEDGTHDERHRYHWKELIDCIRHPYLKMLHVNGRQPLRVLFHRLEDSVRRSGRFFDPRDWEYEAREHAAFSEGADPAEVVALFRRLMDVCLTRWEEARTLRDTAEALDELCTVLVEHGGDLWERFPIDGECIYRLRHAVLPALRQSLISEEKFPRDVLFTILRELTATQRVPFEAEPLTGLQVLGMLETRLLRFRTVFVVNATDDKLPGGPNHDPLMPDSLRTMLGLPDRSRRETVAAYNFHRLISGARNVGILYQTGAGGSGLLDDKAVRSRYVEELLWEQEKKKGGVIKPSPNGPLYAVAPRVSSPRRGNRIIPVTPSVRARLDARLDRALSPSMLDTFLRCPARFYYEHLTPLQEMEAIDEDGAASAIGSLTHNVLRDFLSPYLNQPIVSPAKAHGGALSPDTAALRTLFTERLAADPDLRQMALDMRLLLEVTGSTRLEKFLENLPDTTVAELEEAYEASVIAAGRTFRLGGRLDRVDYRNGQDVVIVDYKTGSISTPRKGFWEDETVWAGVDEALEGGPRGDALAMLHAGLRSVQLPCYMYMYESVRGQSAYDACWVELKDTGQEKYLIGKAEDDLREEIVTRRIPSILRLLCLEIAEAERFDPRPDRHCDWCPFRTACENSA